MILAFLACFVIGALVPQRPLLGEVEYQAATEHVPAWILAFTESMGLDDVYHSLGMQVLFALFSLQILVYVVRKAPRIWREAHELDTHRLESSPARLMTAPGDQDLSGLARRLSSMHYHVEARDDTTVVARKNRHSAFAGLLFHASFLLVLGGAWILQRNFFRGDLILAEGQTSSGMKMEYARTEPRIIGESAIPKMVLTPRSISPVFSPSGGTIDIRCEILTPDSDQPTEIRVNQPFKKNDTDVLLMGFGLAPVIIVRKKGEARPVDVVCANLGVWGIGHPEDDFTLRSPKARVTARFFPDFKNGLPIERQSSTEIRNAVLEVFVQPEDETIPSARGQLKPGESLAFGDYTMQLGELRKWGRFQVSRMKGDLLVLGLVLMAVAAAFRLLMLEKSILLTVDTQDGSKSIQIRTKAGLFPRTFERELPRILGTPIQDCPPDAD